jgi:hypothetical protein
VQPQTIDVVEQMRRRSDNAVLDAMNALAADTGGFLVESRNDLRGGLREMLKDTETYYVLAYESTNSRRDGGFRKIEVRLPAVPGVKLRTRSGYFAPDARRLHVATTEEATARRNEQRRAEMQIALGSLAPLTGITVRLSADFVSVERGLTELVVSGNVDVRTLSFVRLRDHRQATLETVAIVLDDAGTPVSTLPTQRTSMDIGDADYERLVRDGIPYQNSVTVTPGRYQVRLAAREDATGLLGSAWQTVEVPNLAPGHLALSSLFLLREGETPQPADPAASQLVLRNAQALRRFSRAESLYAQIYAYNPKRDGTGASDLVSQAQVLRGGHLLGTAAPETVEEAGPGGPPLLHTSRIKLQHFEPGEYELRVTVTDRKASAMVTRRVGFTVE